MSRERGKTPCPRLPRPRTATSRQASTTTKPLLRAQAFMLPPTTPSHLLEKSSGISRTLPTFFAPPPSSCRSVLLPSIVPHYLPSTHPSLRSTLSCQTLDRSITSPNHSTISFFPCTSSSPTSHPLRPNIPFTLPVASPSKVSRCPLFGPYLQRKQIGRLLSKLPPRLSSVGVGRQKPRSRPKTLPNIRSMSLSQCPRSVCPHSIGVPFLISPLQSLFQEKDYMNGRVFQKRAYFLAVLASALADSNPAYELFYDSTSGDPRYTTLVLNPRKCLLSSLHSHVLTASQLSEKLTSSMSKFASFPSFHNLLLLSTVYHPRAPTSAHLVKTKS